MNLHLPLGFRFAGVSAGIKRNSAKEDLTLVHCPNGATAAGVYTTNLVYAAPVAVDRARTPSADIRIVIEGLSANTERLDGVEVRLDRVEGRLNGVENELGGVKAMIRPLIARSDA